MGSTGEPIGKLATEVARLSLTSSSILLLRSSHLLSHRPLSSIAQPTIPPRMNYELTVLGKSLLQPIQQLGMWVMNNVDAIENARRRYDKVAARHTKGPAARKGWFLEDQNWQLRPSRAKSGVADQMRLVRRIPV